jgi:primosomal protein N' (replication factor Y)
MAIARVALPVPAWQPFDYWIPDGLATSRGDVVRVRFGLRKCRGVVVDVSRTSDVVERLQPIESVCDGERLPDDVMELAQFTSTYYHAPPGLAYALVTPPVATRDRRKNAAVANAPAEAKESRRETLNDAQLRAVTTILEQRDAASPVLLHGITGSGKTAVYLAAVERVVKAGGQALLLVPEINLTPQFEERVRSALPRVRAVTLHSRLAAGARRVNWQAAANGMAHVILATRLGVFVPLPRLALVVIDEEHDDSYKQQDGVRYHARDLALWRARRRAIPIVLGSATPSLETWARAQSGRYRLSTLPERADVRARLPEVRFARVGKSKHRDPLSAELRDALAAGLSAGEQSLLFINRRGYAPSLKCAACTWESACPRCTARLVLHREPVALKCHHCGHTTSPPHACPECGNVDLLPTGFGTQRLEQAIRAAFPHARTARVDRDTTQRKDAFAKVKERVLTRDIDILIGTQMLAKGHDFPRLTLVGVLGADNALYSGDFRATERLAALLMQVAGRAGRSDLPGTVIVQTDFPEHGVYRALAAHDYARLADDLLAERRAAQLPPATRIALLFAEAHARADVDRFLDDAVSNAHTLLDGGREVEVFPGIAPAMSKRDGFERGQVLVQSMRRGPLQAFLTRWREALLAANTKRVRWTIDVDPAGL